MFWKDYKNACKNEHGVQARAKLRPLFLRYAQSFAGNMINGTIDWVPVERFEARQVCCDRGLLLKRIQGTA